MFSGQYCCTLNPAIGREEEFSTAPLPAEKKDVVVIGGGVGGMQAAITAAKRGHRVRLYEKSGRLGGVLLCEEKVPFKKHMTEYLERQARRLVKAGVELHLNHALTPEEAEGLGADVIIAAIGSRPALPPIPGLETTVPVTEAYEQPEKLGRKVVILGGGMAGTELAIYLRSFGKEPVVVEMEKRLNFANNGCHGSAVQEQLRKLEIPVHTETKVTAVTSEGAVCETPEGSLTLPADSVVNALGRVPLQEEAAAFALCAPTFYPIGDCLAAKNVYEANRLGFNVAMDIGK